MKENKPLKTRSWRDLQAGPGHKRLKTRASRERKLGSWLKVTATLALAAGFVLGIGGLYWLGKTMKSEREAEQAAQRFAINVAFETDGVLTQQWFVHRFKEIIPIDLRDLDLQQLKQQIESSEAQIKSASLVLDLPSTLKVNITEREPVLRLRVMNNKESVVLLVGKDGVLYQGHNYPIETLRRIPGVAGVKLKKKDDQYLPIEGIEPVADFLDQARSTIPAAYHKWQLVDLKDWDPDEPYNEDLIRITSSTIESIVFSTRHVETQLEELSQILEHTERYQLEMPKEIDLSYNNEAVVRYN